MIVALTDVTLGASARVIVLVSTTLAMVVFSASWTVAVTPVCAALRVMVADAAALVAVAVLFSVTWVALSTDEIVEDDCRLPDETTVAPTSSEVHPAVADVTTALPLVVTRSVTDRTPHFDAR